jgi:hypothetical protein
MFVSLLQRPQCTVLQRSQHLILAQLPCLFCACSVPLQCTVLQSQHSDPLHSCPFFYALQQSFCAFRLQRSQLLILTQLPSLLCACCSAPLHCVAESHLILWHASCLFCASCSVPLQCTVAESQCSDPLAQLPMFVYGFLAFFAVRVAEESAL